MNERVWEGSERRETETAEKEKEVQEEENEEAGGSVHSRREIRAQSFCIITTVGLCVLASRHATRLTYFACTTWHAVSTCVLTNSRARRGKTRRWRSRRKRGGIVQNGTGGIATTRSRETWPRSKKRVVRYSWLADWLAASSENVPRRTSRQ